MKAKTFCAVVVVACLFTVTPLLQHGTRAQNPCWQPVVRAATEQEVVALRQRVRMLENHLARLEKSLCKFPAEAARPLGRVREIKILGNYKTCDTVILAQLPFKPGSVFCQADLDLAVRRLELLHIFQCDIDRQTNPTVEILPGWPADETDYKDIAVRIQEKE